MKPKNTQKKRRIGGPGRFPSTSGLLGLAALVLLALALAGCAAGPESRAPERSAEELDQSILAVASQYAQSGDLNAARALLDALDLSNDRQAVLAQAENYIAQDQDRQATLDLIALAEALGPLSRMASDYLIQNGEAGAAALVAAPPPAVPSATPTPLPPTDTPTPLPPTDTPEPTVGPTDTPEPTAAPTDTPVTVARLVVEGQALNVRSGPGTLYPVVGRMAQGDAAEILARNEASSWWQVAQGWVSGTLVRTEGPVDQVVVATNIAPPPATPTAAAPPTPTPPPQPAGPPFVITGFRLRSVGEHAQSCTGGDHNIWVTVLDRNGSPMNGVAVKEIYTGQIVPTGSQGKGDGNSVYDIYRGGGGVVVLIDGAGNPLSPQSPGMSADWPPFELISSAGYCSCKPHPDEASCRADLESHNYLFAVGHYVYEVIFRQQ